MTGRMQRPSSRSDQCCWEQQGDVRGWSSGTGTDACVSASPGALRAAKHRASAVTKRGGTQCPVSIDVSPLLFRGRGAAQVVLSWALSLQLVSLKPRPGSGPTVSPLPPMALLLKPEGLHLSTGSEQPGGVHSKQQFLCLLSCWLGPAVRCFPPQQNRPHLFGPNQSPFLLQISLNYLPNGKPSLCLALFPTPIPYVWHLRCLHSGGASWFPKGKNHVLTMNCNYQEASYPPAWRSEAEIRPLTGNISLLGPAGPHFSDQLLDGLKMPAFPYCGLFLDFFTLI